MASCALLSCLVLQGIGRKATMERESLEVFVEDEPYVLAPSR